MSFVSTTDVTCAGIAATAAAIYGFTSMLPWLSSAAIEPLIPTRPSNGQAKRSDRRAFPSRNIHKLLEQSGKRCVVLYGTETGTAEKLAWKLAKDFKASYGLESVVGDLDDYDYDELAALDERHMLVLLIATAGEGEPTTNASRFLKHLEALESTEVLKRLRYAAFGLGSSSYRLFNQAVKSVGKNLAHAGAHRIGPLGLGDDGKGTLEDDFLLWQAATVPMIASSLGLQKKPYVYEPSLAVKELGSAAMSPVLDGEPNKAQLYGRVKGPFTVANPFPAKISRSYQLSTSKSQKRYMHMEFDTSHSTLSYQTGDHLSILPTNPEIEVHRFLEVFGLQGRANTVIEVSTKDPDMTSPITALTTYKAAVSKYMDICGPVSRQSLAVLAGMTHDMASRDAIGSLASDADKFAAVVRAPCLNLAQLLQTRTAAGAWRNLDLAILLELVGPLKPRYYSISSSNVLSRKTISITVAEESRVKAGQDFDFHGVSTSYLSELLGTTGSRSGSRTSGPNGLFDRPTAYISVRRSQFRLPRQTSTPIIMVGPGTGVAPFRAFVQERACQSAQGKEVGQTVLFYGCRRDDEDFLYKDEWRVSLWY